MSDGADWQDPFTQDPDAIERERRRAEREARRRGRQQSLGEKVQESEAEQAAATAPPPPAAPAAPVSLEPIATPVAPPPLTDEHAVAPPLPPALGPRRPPGGSGPSSSSVRNRRIFGAIVFLIVLGLLAFGVIKVVDRLGGGDAPPPAKTKPLQVENLTIPEGLDRHQIADVAKKAGLKGDYERASKSFKGFDPKKYGADNAPNLEGFLFPATYELPKKGTVKDLISRQLDAFEQNIKGVDLSYAESKNLNVYDVLKIASMIEREVQVPKERPLVAEVIYNRLKAGTPLGIDATIRYEDQNYDQQLLLSRLQQDTPYNTRTHPGLPPTPIGNPGLDSIKAAANPAKGKLFFFVVKPGTCGEHTFVETDAEFQQAEAAYQQALQEQGGSPTQC
jgi:cell division protein YceG involved in septum cleavage